MDWFGFGRQSSLCDICLEKARSRGLADVYVYKNGHMLRYSDRLPSLSDWPRGDDVRTYCGLNVYGMGSSTLYQVDRVER